MSADKHRGIRRQKQKRAKAVKRQAREQRTTPVTITSTPPSPAASKPAA